MIYTEIRNIVYILIRKMVKVMKKAEVVTRLIKEAGYSKRAFAEKIGLPTTLQSMLSRGIGKASVDNVIKVCKGLGITTDDLERLATQEDNTVKEEVSIYETIQKSIKHYSYSYHWFCSGWYTYIRRRKY